MHLARVAAALLLLVCAACMNDEEEPAPDETPSSAEPRRTQTAPTIDPQRPTFSSEVRPLTAEERRSMTGVSWHQGCPVPLDRLRHVTLSHWDFAGRARTGVLIVRADVADEVAGIFGRMFKDRFPIRRMVPVDEYDGDDFTSIEADNTSAFNCRPATGSTEWSHHAYGLAIDINPIENPYVLDGRTIHPASEPYLDRDRKRPGVLLEGGPVVKVFEAAGWYWGGDWENPIDYQHFSKLPAD